MTATVMVVDDEDTARINITKFLMTRGYEVISVPTLAEARTNMARGDADIILLDVELPDGYGPNLLYEAMQAVPRPSIIIITAHGDIDMAVDAMKNGAQDFLQKPIDLNRLEQSVQRSAEIVQLRRELNHLRSTQNTAADHFIIGSSVQMKQVVTKAERAASHSFSVLITGETGTGKEVLANFIHKSGPRAAKPFIAVNCAAIQATMLESELFGHEAGAFTSADKKKPGLMEVADTGILFLDEISSMPLDIQAKLLRAIDEHAFRRVGGTNLIKVDVQILAASNRPLLKMIADGQFREDLYYRLKVVDLHLPPLKERKEDIPELVGFFIKETNRRNGLNIQDISPRAMSALVAHDWPGNLRELRNAVEYSMLFCDEATIDLPNLPTELQKMAA